MHNHAAGLGGPAFSKAQQEQTAPIQQIFFVIRKGLKIEWNLSYAF
jgi:hypothetical protein